MQIIRYRDKKSEISYGWIHDKSVGQLSASPYETYRRLDASLSLDDLEILNPVTPGKIIAIGRNYAEHAAEHEVEIPDIPLIFLKPPSSVIGPGETIILPPQSQQVEHEAELAVVIGRKGRWLELENVQDHILGYTIANDVTARDLQWRDGQWTRAKGFDTFCPVGPWIETEFEPSDALITCRVNGELRQMSSTREMVFDIPQLIVYISSVMTLLPGDLILTGTPAGVNELQDGDEVEIEIEGIGKLKNQVSARQSP